jgi:hypothetical protein
MSVESAVIEMLLVDTVLAGLVGDNVEPGILSQPSSFPALVASHVSTVAASHLNVKENGHEALRTRIQVTAFAETYPQAKALLDGVRRACANRRGTFDGVVVRNCRVELEGPDFKTDDDQAFCQSLDLLVSWIRAL